MIIFKFVCTDRQHLNATKHFTSQINNYKLLKELSWNTTFKSADVSLGYSTKVTAQKDMQHPTTNWYSVNSANYLEFVMVLPMGTITRISHVTLYTHVLLIWILWPVTELWRDLSQRDSLEFSIRIPTFFWVIPVLSVCTMSLAASRMRPQHILLLPLSNQASYSLVGRLWGQHSKLTFLCQPVNLCTTH